MREIFKILSYCAAVVVGAALLAPPLFWAGQWAVQTGLLPQLEPFGFSKYFNRATLVVALALLWPFLRWMGLRRVADLQIQPNPRRWRDVSTGVIVAAVGLLMVACVLVLTEQVELRHRIRWGKVGAALATGVTVGVLEELFFRGALFGMLRRRLPWPRALGFLSVFFAVLHFIKPDPDVGKVMTVDWLSGFRLLPHSFWQFRELDLVLGGWVTLVLVGVVLGYSVVKTRSLYMAIGLHAGWVFALRTFSRHTKRVAPPSIWAGEQLTTGLLAAGLLLLTWALLVWLLRRRDDEALTISHEHLP